MICVLRKIQIIPSRTNFLEAACMGEREEERNHRGCLYGGIRGNVSYDTASIRDRAPPPDLPVYCIQLLRNVNRNTGTTISPILQQYRVTRMSRRSVRSDARAAFIDRFERWPHEPSRTASTPKFLVDTSMNQLPDRPIATPINNRSEIGSR